MTAVGVAPVFCLSSVLFVCHVNSQAQCIPGWFGPRCKYKCHCTNNYCDTNGLCTGSTGCQGGWFGPACQYAYKKADITEITDGDDSTCMSAASEGTVSIKLNAGYHIMWIRVRLSTPGFLTDLNVIYIENSRAYHPFWPSNATVDDKTVDIYSIFFEPIDEVNLTGAGANHLCSVYVSGGRNIALKETAMQSSTYVETSQLTYQKRVAFTADKAVDGIKNQHFYQGRSCSSTIPRATPKVSWNISFSMPRLVDRYILYSRVDDKRDNPRQFLTQSMDDTSVIVFSYRDASKVQQSVYKWHHFPMTVTRVFISSHASQNTLTLCELEIYGDSDCLNGKYGLDCEHTCHCPANVSCYYSTGGCPSGCPAGFNGEDCKTPCASDKYGSGCLYNCSEFCLNDGTKPRSCNVMDGRCLQGCMVGYTGYTCTETCLVNAKGYGCVKNCSENCINHRKKHMWCDDSDGACLLGCAIGYIGVTCTRKCMIGQFGQDCKSSCSKNCVPSNDTTISSCNHVNGECLRGCQGGYIGLLCNEASGETSINLYVGFVAGLLILIVACACIPFCLCKKHPPLVADKVADQAPEVRIPPHIIALQPKSSGGTEIL